MPRPEQVHIYLENTLLRSWTWFEADTIAQPLDPPRASVHQGARRYSSTSWAPSSL
jgi:hypothetical protein